MYRLFDLLLLKAISSTAYKNESFILPVHRLFNLPPYKAFVPFILQLQAIHTAGISKSRYTVKEMVGNSQYFKCFCLPSRRQNDEGTIIKLFDQWGIRTAFPTLMVCIPLYKPIHNQFDSCCYCTLCIIVLCRQQLQRPFDCIDIVVSRSFL